MVIVAACDVCRQRRLWRICYRSASICRHLNRCCTTRRQTYWNMSSASSAKCCRTTPRLVVCLWRAAASRRFRRSKRNRAVHLPSTLTPSTAASQRKLSSESLSVSFGLNWNLGSPTALTFVAPTRSCPVVMFSSAGWANSMAGQKLSACVCLYRLPDELWS